MAERRSQPTNQDPLEAELLGLAAALVIDPPTAALESSVMSMLASEPAPAPPSPVQRGAAAAAQALNWLVQRWRAVLTVLAGILLVLVVVTPAGARIAEWFGFGAVQIVRSDAPAGSAPPVSETLAIKTSAIKTSAIETSHTELSLAEARQLVPFPIGVPAVLGDPDRVSVGADARVVSMVWVADPAAAAGTAGPVLLDQLSGQPDPLVVKKYFEDIEFGTVGGTEALWLERPHPLVYLDAAGHELTSSARTSGPSLIWQRGPFTLRLEGVPVKERAIAIAESVS